MLGLILSLAGCAKDYNVTFLSSSCLTPYKRFDFKLCDDFNVQVNYSIYTVPKGFVTDLASVPRVMWAYYSPNDARTIPAAILHDFMYRINLSVTRKQADDIFYHALIKGGTSKAKAVKYYLGIRLFGWMFFRK